MLRSLDTQGLITHTEGYLLGHCFTTSRRCYRKTSTQLLGQLAKGYNSSRGKRSQSPTPNLKICHMPLQNSLYFCLPSKLLWSQHERKLESCHWPYTTRPQASVTMEPTNCYAYWLLEQNTEGNQLADAQISLRKYWRSKPIETSFPKWMVSC